ncbi:hypothetical protein E2562_011773 [Oryza meyeriana var. granulata]|uniref:Exocyst complex subunit Exo70 C-terminal domain-containing protein n=1 Tax=Oryza meyeriana var. granulata TaxID=110450 RepID=A0A6G1CQ39_9ORYZ|nr:hypothetical protein E2562_011773 [Oryza meyeriana var. granulata]
MSVLWQRRDPLATFYSVLENACSAQRCWKVPSPVLRRLLQRTMLDHVVPAYHQYLEEVEGDGYWMEWTTKEPGKNQLFQK